MKLGAWLDHKEMSDELFGQRIGVSRQAVHRYRNGERWPSRDVMAKIVMETAGMVTPDDFLPAEASAQ